MVHKSTQTPQHNSTVEDRRRDIFNKNLIPVFRRQFFICMAKKEGTPRPNASILAHKKSVEKQMKIICMIE